MAIQMEHALIYSREDPNRSLYCKMSVIPPPPSQTKMKYETETL
jgi:hypothetical protein